MCETLFSKLCFLLWKFIECWEINVYGFRLSQLSFHFLIILLISWLFLSHLDLVIHITSFFSIIGVVPGVINFFNSFRVLLLATIQPSLARGGLLYVSLGTPCIHIP